MDSLPKSSQVANRSNGPPYLQTIDSDDGMSCKGQSMLCALTFHLLIQKKEKGICYESPANCLKTLVCES